MGVSAGEPASGRRPSARGRRARWRVGLLVAVAAALVAGCGSASPPLLRGTIAATKSTNPDVHGRPSPVVVRVFELKSLSGFNGADFFTLFEKEQEALGSELVAREEYSLRPGESRPYQRQLQPDTKFIGVVAAFRDLENSRWRQAAAVPAKRSPTLAVGVDTQAVTVEIK